MCGAPSSTSACCCPSRGRRASEYTNGGYLSDDTLFNTFALPRESALDPAGFTDLLPNSLSKRRYFSKVADGDKVTHFVAEGSLWNRLRFSFGSASYILDDRTYADAGRRLMPRAVGYSAALFDYFFREQLEISAPGQFVYGKAVYQPDHPERGFGQFTRLRDFTEYPFDFSASPIPVNAGDLRLIVVFQGEVGEESSAVAVGIKDLLEPDPVDYVNGTDWECFQGTLYNVADTALFPPGDFNARDIDGNHSIDLFAPWVEEGVRLKTSDPYGFLQLPSDTAFDLKAPSLSAFQGARTARVVILQDQPFYLVAASDDLIFGFESVFQGDLAAFYFGGIVNDVAFTDFGPVHRITLNGSYRGVSDFHNIVRVTQATLPCFDRTSNLKPDSVLASPPDIEVNP